MKGSILIVDDEYPVRDVLGRKFERQGYRVRAAANADEALGILEEESYDLALVDRRMPGMDGIRLLKRIKRIYPSTEVVVITAYGDVPSAVEAMKLGANDYITKPFELEEIAEKVDRIFRSRAYLSQDSVLQMEVAGGLEIPGYGMMTGISGEMKGIFRVIDALSHNMSSVLIQGESGTGKEMVARAIHGRGLTRDKPFIAASCGNISSSLLMSQLFGHVKGAFTGAVEHSKGYFRSAEGGSIFLDEIVDTEKDFQARLLRVLQEREVVPLGSSEVVRVTVRVMAATNQDPEYALNKGLLREDLYYRLNTITVKLPPLRQRREDIPALTGYFLRRFAGEFKCELKSVHPDTMEIFYQYHWPGNVRELMHVIERCYAIGTGDIIRLENIPDQIKSEGGRQREEGRGQRAEGMGQRAESIGQRAEGISSPSALRTPHSALQPLSLKEAEKECIRRALKKAGGNKAEAARILGIERPRLYRKMKKYGLN